MHLNLPSPLLSKGHITKHEYLMNLKNITKIALGLTLLMILTSMAPADRWNRLGSRTVNYGLDRDVIQVGARKGTYTKLKVAVTGGAINMHKVIVHYKNGSKQDIPLRHNFNRRSTTRLIDLAGNKRYIDKIVFYYDTKNLARSRAKVHVYGRS